jgi:hypothetical protein
MRRRWFALTLWAALADPSQGAQAPLAQSADSTDSVMLVARRGWHIDIGFATVDLQPPLSAVAAEFAGAQYVFFGFGDKHYLLSKSPRSLSLIGALWPGPGMILATALNGSPQEAFGVAHVAVLHVSLNQMHATQLFIWRALQTESEQVHSYAAGPYSGSLYFASTSTYSALHTCNSWAAEGLAQAELPIHSHAVIFAGQLWRQLQRLRMDQPAAPSSSRFSSESRCPATCRADWSHPDKLPSFHRWEAPRPSSFAAPADCCC